MVAIDVVISNEHIGREVPSEHAVVEDDDVTMVDAYKSEAPAASSNNESAFSLSAMEWKERGNTLFQLKKLSESLEAYDHALKVLEQEESSSSQSTSALSISLFSNRALVLYKMRQFRLAEQESSKVLEMDPENVKGALVEERILRCKTTEANWPYSFYFSSKILFRPALLRRACSREGQHLDNKENKINSKTSIQDFLIPAIDDLKKALGVLDKDRLDQDETTPENAKTDNRKLTQECRKTLDRLEKEYRRMSRKEDRQQQQRHRNVFFNEEGNKHNENNPSKQQSKPTPENALGNIANGVYQSSTTHEKPRLLPGTVTTSAAQQKKDVMRLLLARQTMLKSLPSNGNSASSSPEGEAFFFLEWNWWVQWCLYVDFFYLQMIQQGESNKDNNNNKTRYNDNDMPDRVRRVLGLFPPGAVLADQPRVFSSQKKPMRCPTTMMTTMMMMIRRRTSFLILLGLSTIIP
jgi:tetratricopeptide (TPR) repeat protein